MARQWLCNICGSTFYPSEDSFSDHRKCGYNSSHDDDIRDVDICPDCYEKVLQHIQEQSKYNVWITKWLSD